MLSQPISQVRLTNVALIKYKLHNKRFEIACYKNKAINWRNGIEKDLDEVLQSNNIFTNASQGHLANNKDLTKYFPGLDHKAILKIILDNGELQISDKERDSNFSTMFSDIANIITEKCVHSISKRQISLDSVKQAIKDIHFPIKLDQPAKRQALLCLKQLMRKFLLARAEMKIEVTCLNQNKEKLMQELQKIGVCINNETKPKTGDSFALALLIEPAKYRIIDNILKTIIKDGIVEVLIPYVANKEVADIETAGTVNLELRPDYNEGDELKDSEEDSEDDKKKHNTKKNKKSNLEEDEEKNEKKVKNEKKDKKNKKNKKDKKEKQETKDKNDKNGSGNKEKPNEKNKETKEENKEEEEEETKLEKKEAESDKPGKTGGHKCLSCKEATFENNADFRTHFKTQWHNFNLRRKIDKLEGLSEQDYKMHLLDDEFVNQKL